MKRLFSLLIAVILCLSGILPSTACAIDTTPPATAVLDGSAPIDPWAYQKILGKGMDVDWCKTSAGISGYNRQAVADFQQAGISHVRIRVKDDADAALLSVLDGQISDCLEAGIVPVIAYQADALKNNPSRANIRRVADWWRTVAEHYRNISYLVSFDLIIEVTDALNDQPDTLNAIYEEVVSAVRESNPARIVMVSPRLRSDAAYLSELTIPSQANGYLMAEWHFYAAGPSKDNDRKLWTVGTAQERQLIADKIALASQWQAETGIPTWVGAWMPGNYNDGNDYSVEEQTVFASFMVQALTQAGIPFAVNADTHFYDRASNCWIAELQPVFAAVFESKLPFTDVPDSAWFCSAVTYVYENGLFSGTNASTFHPYNNMTRRQLWTVLGRMNGQALSGAGVYEAARQWAISAGISDGSNPEGNITREQLAVILWRYTGTPVSTQSLDAFSDVNSVSAYAKAAMAWAVERGILSGSNGALLPRSNATRAHVAAMLQRMCQSPS